MNQEQMTHIRVLLIEDNRIEARQTESWLTANREVAFDVEWLERLGPALQRLTREGIDVVLLDLNLPDSRGLETYTALHERAPGVPVVVLTGEQDESMGVQAVQLGAADYLVKHQVDAGALARIVRFAVVRHQAQMEQIKRAQRSSMGRVVSVLGARGGVGATTVAINVAVTLAERDKTVILAELKPSFGGLAFSLQREPATSVTNLLELPAERIGEREVSALLCQGPGATRILFGSCAGETSAELDADRAVAIINGLARLADFVILDLPAWPSPAAASAVRLSQYVALVTEREPIAVRCAQAAVAQLQSWGVGGGQVGAIVVSRNNLPLSMDLTAIRAQLGCEILRVVPSAAAACCLADAAGMPLLLSQPQNDAAVAYVDIARAVAGEQGVRFEAA